MNAFRQQTDAACEVQFVIDAVETNGTDPTDIRVDLKVPADASGTTSMTLTGRTPTETVELVLEVRVDESATGAITIRSDIPALRGPSTQTFNFSLTVVNDTTEDQSYSATGAGRRSLLRSRSTRP